MYCSQCGKKVTDTMLFCPFCGAAIVIPEQDEAEENAAARTPERAAFVPEETLGAEAESFAEATPEPAIAERSEPEAKPLDETLQAAELEPEPPTLFESGSTGGEPAAEPSPGEAPRRSLREIDDAEAELLDWSQSRKQYATDDPWASDAARTEDFAPLSFEESATADDSWREEVARRKQAAQPQKKAPDMRANARDSLHLDGGAPKLEASIGGAKPVGGKPKKPRKATNTLVPPKQMDPDDIFMDGGSDYDEDVKEAFDQAFAYEEADEDSFFMRHMRGVVGLTLFVILLLMIVIFAFSKAGQTTLAKVNLAWNKEAYMQLGNAFYNAEQYAQAGQYYERALKRDPDNYDYASSAALAYKEAGNTEKAAEMFKRCAEIRPESREPYIYLLNLYPTAAQRPWEITQIIRQGYERTHDESLNVAG